jgi:hypothetical protein
MNRVNATYDHGAAVAGWATHFFDVVGNQLIGGFRMTRVDLTEIVYKTFG